MQLASLENHSDTDKQTDDSEDDIENVFENVKRFFVSEGQYNFN